MKLILRQDGLTLVEVMIATLLVLMISLSILGSQITARHLSRKARLEVEAVNRAQSVLEQQKSLDYDSIVPWTANNVLISDNGTPADATDDILGTTQFTVTDNGTSKTLNVTIAWTHLYFGQEQNSNVSLSTIVADI